jgi:UDP-N-acetyl-D-glucosamine dehydrogenase
LIETRAARIGIIGLGYVGLPMALEFCRVGFDVTGFDQDTARCAMLKDGRSYIADVGDDEIHDALVTNRFRTSTHMDALADMDAVLICVPTPLRKSKDPDLTAIMSASDALAPRLRPGQLIILESTTYPGTTEELLLPMFESTGLRAGAEFFLGFSPERIDPGNPHFDVSNITKLVGGVTSTCTQLAAALYRQMVRDVVEVSSPRVAETSKLLENTFRSVNIALANEMSIICSRMGINVWEVIDAAATKPFGFMPHYPGPGIGGHCIPLDPHYLSWKARLSGYEPRFISLASEINSHMPRHVVDLVADALNGHSKCVRRSRILILGVAYKPNVGDYRESPALEIIEMLHDRGAVVKYSDPYVPSLGVGDVVLRHEELTDTLLAASDCVVVVTHHKIFPYERIVRESPLVVDTRNVTRPYANVGNVHFI